MNVYEFEKTKEYQLLPEEIRDTFRAIDIQKMVDYDETIFNEPQKLVEVANYINCKLNNKGIDQRPYPVIVGKDVLLVNYSSNDEEYIFYANEKFDKHSEFNLITKELTRTNKDHIHTGIKEVKEVDIYEFINIIQNEEEEPFYDSEDEYYPDIFTYDKEKGIMLKNNKFMMKCTENEALNILAHDALRSCFYYENGQGFRPLRNDFDFIVCLDYKSNNVVIDEEIKKILSDISYEESEEEKARLKEKLYEHNLMRHWG